MRLPTLLSIIHSLFSKRACERLRVALPKTNAEPAQAFLSAENAKNLDRAAGGHRSAGGCDAPAPAAGAAITPDDMERIVQAVLRQAQGR